MFNNFQGSYSQTCATFCRSNMKLKNVEIRASFLAFSLGLAFSCCRFSLRRHIGWSSNVRRTTIDLVTNEHHDDNKRGMFNNFSLCFSPITNARRYLETFFATAIWKRCRNKHKRDTKTTYKNIYIYSHSHFSLENLFLSFRIVFWLSLWDLLSLAVCLSHRWMIEHHEDDRQQTRYVQFFSLLFSIFSCKHFLIQKNFRKKISPEIFLRVFRKKILQQKKRLNQLARMQRAADKKSLEFVAFIK